MNEAVLVEGLTKTYAGKTVVNHLNLSVKSGTVFGLLGANGAGKSTTIECILGTKQADSGTVRLLGQDPKKKRRALFQRIGVQFQEGDYQQEIKVSELCEETASLYRNPADWHALCEQFGIGDKAKVAVKSLSGGERQRLFIVLALIPQPELVFLDELTTGLDAKARRFLSAHAGIYDDEKHIFRHWYGKHTYPDLRHVRRYRTLYCPLCAFLSVGINASGAAPRRCLGLQVHSCRHFLLLHLRNIYNTSYK